MDSFRFANPEYLYLLLLIPLFILVFAFGQMRAQKSLNKFVRSRFLQRRLVPEKSRVRPILKFLMINFALMMFVIAMARPQFGAKLKTEMRSGSDIMIALDVSKSMMAEDVKPNRLARAKFSIESLINKLHGDNLGIVVFAGSAYTQLPITSDKEASKLFLSTISTDLISRQGTNIASAIDLCMNSFSPTSEAGKAIVIITDGEDHEQGAIDAAKQAADEGIRVYTIGIGLPEGGVIPNIKNGVRQGYIKDSEGTVVVSRLNAKALEDIATAGNGKYIQTNESRVGLSQVFDELRKLEKGESEVVEYSEYNEQYQYFVILGLLTLLMEGLLLHRRNRVLMKLNIFGENSNA
ncbi:MAG: VWA domain-containing protein [Bacteroidales bacterium]